MPRIEPAVTPRKRALFASLKSAYSEGGIPALREAYIAAAKQNVAIRALWKSVDVMCPVSRFLDWTVRLNDLIADRGYHSAATRVLDELPLRWESQFSPGSEEVVRSVPLVLYGNHPSQITSLILSAALGRADLRFFSISFFTKFLPSAEPFVFPLRDSTLRTWRDLLGGGLTHSLALYLLYKVDEEETAPDAREHNRGMLRSAAEHVRGGGSVFIHPMGGTPGWRDWFPGIGVLAQELAQTAEKHPAYFVPFHVENESNERLYALIAASATPLARVRLRKLDRDPVRIRFGRPARVQEITADSTLSASVLASLMQQDYLRLFPGADRSR